MDFKHFVECLQNCKFPMGFPGHWINGQWLAQPRGTPIKESTNPSTNETIIEVLLEKSTLGKAIDAAAGASETLANLEFNDRIRILKSFRQALADYQATALEAMCIEAGKPQWEAAQDFDSSIRYLDWITDNHEAVLDGILAPAKLSSIPGNYTMQPLGVTAAFLPFSTPLTSFVYYFAGTLLAGCPLVLVSSSHAVLTGLLLGFIDQEIKLPTGALNIIFGNFTVFKQTLADKRVQAIVYTGSREHCDILRREARSFAAREMILQSGGKNSLLVHSSADVSLAVRCAAFGMTKSAGQLCTSTSRAFVHSSKREEFCAALVDYIGNMQVGRTDKPKNASDRGPFMGPLYSKKAVEKFLRFQTMAHRDAKTTLRWGKAIETGTNGYFVTPGIHLMADFDPNSAYQSNVLFCPDLAIYEYDVLENAFAMMNTTDAPFATAFIGDAEILTSRTRQLVAPNILLNMPTVEYEAMMPLAGRWQSGEHRYNNAALALLLSYPKVIISQYQGSGPLKAWP